MKPCYANSSVLTIMIFFKKTCNHNNLTNTEVWLSKNLDLIQTHYLQILTSYNDKYNHCIYHLSAHSLMVTCDLPSHHSHAASVLNGPDFIAGDKPDGHPLQVTRTRGPSAAGDMNQRAIHCRWHKPDGHVEVPHSAGMRVSPTLSMQLTVALADFL